MKIETLDDWNMILSGCDCCPMPVCPEPLKECESFSRSATSEDDDYTDALAAWTAGGGVGDPPAKPAGYDDVDHGSWLPFTEPGASPTLYQTLETEDETTLATGNMKVWHAYGEAEFYGDEGLAQWNTYDANAAGLIDWNWVAYRWGVSGVEPEPHGGYGVVTDDTGSETLTGFPNWTGIPWVADDPPVAEPCTSTTRETVSASRQAAAGGTAVDKSGDFPQVAFESADDPPANGDAAASSGWPLATDLEHTDLTERTATVQTLGSPVILEDVRDRAAGKMEDWPEESEGIDCDAKFDSDWPEPGDWLDPWPACSSGALPVTAVGNVTLTRSRFRWAVPDTWEGSYYKITWDILEEPDGWNDTIDDPDYTPPEEEPEGGFPPVPQIPNPDRPSRSFYQLDQTWEWTGPGDPENADSWKSGWYEIDPPAVPGTRRVVNVRFECYKSTKFGVKPQIMGEGVEL